LRVNVSYNMNLNAYGDVNADGRMFRLPNSCTRVLFSLQNTEFLDDAFGFDIM
jgi:hypothetical protein